MVFKTALSSSNGAHSTVSMGKWGGCAWGQLLDGHIQPMVLTFPSLTELTKGSHHPIILKYSWLALPNYNMEKTLHLSSVLLCPSIKSCLRFLHTDFKTQRLFILVIVYWTIYPKCAQVSCLDYSSSRTQAFAFGQMLLVGDLSIMPSLGLHARPAISTEK